MTTDTDGVAVVVEDWLERAPGQEDPESVLARILAELDATPQRWRTWPQVDARALAMIAVAVTVVALIVAIGVTTLPGSGTGSGPGASEPAGPSESPGPTSDPPAGTPVDGIAPEGAVPTDPDAGALILSLDANIVGGGPTMRVYEDGRVVWMRWPDSTVAPASSGFVARRLTPAGIDYVRSLVLETGLFDDDLLLSSEANFFDLSIERDGRWVRVVWARTEDWGLGPARSPTSDEAETLTELARELLQRGVMPGWIWTGGGEAAYVPTLNAVCLRRLPQAAEPRDLWDALPDDVTTFVHRVDRATPRETATDGCARLTVDDTHQLVRLLDVDGVERVTPPSRDHYLRYTLPDPRIPGNHILVMFGPVLPDGEVVLLGPG